MHAANNSKLFEKFNQLSRAIYETEVASAEIEHKEPIIVGFFILQCAQLRMLELYYGFFLIINSWYENHLKNSFFKFCDVHKFEDLGMDTDSLYLVLAEEELEDCNRPKLKAKWERLWSKDWIKNLTADAVAISFPRRWSDKHIKRQDRAWTLQKGVQMHREAMFM